MSEVESGDLQQIENDSENEYEEGSEETEGSTDQDQNEDNNTELEHEMIDGHRERWRSELQNAGGRRSARQRNYQYTEFLKKQPEVDDSSALNQLHKWQKGAQGQKQRKLVGNYTNVLQKEGKIENDLEKRGDEIQQELYSSFNIIIDHKDDNVDEDEVDESKGADGDQLPEKQNSKIQYKLIDFFVLKKARHEADYLGKDFIRISEKKPILLNFNYLKSRKKDEFNKRYEERQKEKQMGETEREDYKKMKETVSKKILALKSSKKLQELNRMGENGFDEDNNDNDNNNNNNNDDDNIFDEKYQKQQDKKAEAMIEGWVGKKKKIVIPPQGVKSRFLIESDKKDKEKEEKQKKFLEKNNQSETLFQLVNYFGQELSLEMEQLDYHSKMRQKGNEQGNDSGQQGRDNRKNQIRTRQELREFALINLVDLWNSQIVLKKKNALFVISEADWIRWRYH
ncbi:MAG: hypothetical protein EZS28_029739 [Streblomastix strix]|uniref:Uncharacterized protein n=1 Tax=Streblomastix strix TaxID=222440 RepID=A0A5J4UWY2_9EUKA|nr:MAG: hypothetical protein EZS28_029739 [Streblomastix strix]